MEGGNRVRAGGSRILKIVSFAPFGALSIPSSTHGLRRGLHSFANSRLQLFRPFRLKAGGERTLNVGGGSRGYLRGRRGFGTDFKSARLRVAHGRGARDGRDAGLSMIGGASRRGQECRRHTFGVTRLGRQL